MALIPYEPFRHLENMRRELDRFFSNDLSPFKLSFSQGTGHINVDLYETDNEIVASCDIPGLEKKEDVSIDVENKALSISGSLNRVNEVKEEHMHRQERYIGRFQRTIALPSPVSSEGVTASYKNGVLEVRMPKHKGEAKRKIDVQFQ
ncbi:Hsp20/alpha crystallin family protein [Cohnella terricola]|uniref:Hsp20/alpha crystallin family protein n=1 Tax=Cohnella terricola TaxID=1289167 RepID=A0A559JAI8_9BACL|nr:Hsp20/alpha crystallin family protein [Cohnella terricola]TVX96873.1 Hsp20/alpha crystallin family protein [Cohnella terricola]